MEEKLLDMKSKWINKEPGPTCTCGNPTWVRVGKEGWATLLCVLHTPAEGAFFDLPSEKPDKWPNMTNDEMDELVKLGSQEADDREE